MMICRFKSSAMANARDGRHSGGRKAHKPPTGDLHSVFADVYGSRWSELFHALAHPTEHVALQNAFASGADSANADWKGDIAVGPTKASRVALLSFFEKPLTLMCWFVAGVQLRPPRTYVPPTNPRPPHLPAVLVLA